ncbi:MAG: hypothetical protein ACEPOV_04480 [Hyphomicrobiales bacterium]
MIDKIAKVISMVFHPLLVPTYALILILNLNIYYLYALTPASKWIFGIFIFGLTFLIPLVLMVFLKLIGFVSSFRMATKEDRIFPFMLTSIIYCLAYFFVKKFEFFAIFNYLLFGLTVTVVISMIVNIWWKISIHMIGAGGFCGAMIGLSLTLYLNNPLVCIIPILISGFIASARLKLKAHTPSQVYVGFGLGFIVMLSIFGYIA